MPKKGFTKQQRAYLKKFDYGDEPSQKILMIDSCEMTDEQAIAFGMSINRSKGYYFRWFVDSDSSSSVITEISRLLDKKIVSLPDTRV